MTKRLILMLLLSCSPLWAATYYVDNCVAVGNDLNNGTSPSTAWLTINKVNTSKFLPGDSILFQSTCTWREQLTVPSSGAAGSPITFGAYGTGAAPIISGANLFTSWTPSAGSLYYASYSTAPNQVFEDGARLTQNTVSAASLTAGQWYLDTVNSRIWVYLTAGDSPSGHTMEASQRDDGVLVQTENYVTVEDLAVTMANSNYGGGIEVVASNYTTIKNCDISYSYFHGIWVWHSTMDSTYGVIQNCTVSYNGATGINLADHARYWTIQNNTVHHNCALSVVNLYTAGIRLVGDGTVSNITIQNNQVYSNGLGQAASIGAGVWIDTQSQNNIVRWNNVYGNQFDNIRIEISSDNQVYCNIASGSIAASGISVTGRTGTPISGVVVYNNTSYGNHVSGLQAWGDLTAGSIVNNTFKNNISVGNGTFQLDAAGGGENDGSDGSGNVYTYNDFGAQSPSFIQWGFGNYESTYTAWETATGNCVTTGCSHSVEAAPTFANSSAGQFWLTSGSPGIDSGATLGSPFNIGLMPGSAWPNSVVTGDQNAFGSGWEIGAFIYVPAGPAPPTNLQTVAH